MALVVTTIYHISPLLPILNQNNPFVNMFLHKFKKIFWAWKEWAKACWILSCLCFLADSDKIKPKYVWNWTTGIWYIRWKRVIAGLTYYYSPYLIIGFTRYQLTNFSPSFIRVTIHTNENRYFDLIPWDVCQPAWYCNFQAGDRP